MISPIALRAWLFLLVLVCSPVLMAGPTELQPFTASYGITRGKSPMGSAELQLQKMADGRWSYQLHMQLRRTGLLGAALFFSSTPPEQTIRSVFLLEDGRVVPQRFTVDEGTGTSGSDQKLDFDWKRGRVTGVFERKPVDLSTQPGLLDSQSVQVALMSELLAGRTPQRFVLVEKGKIRDYIYATERTETLTTDIGEHRTVVYRSSRVGSDKSTVFWCAPELGYLPLKVERRDGKSVEFTLTVKSLQLAGATVR